MASEVRAFFIVGNYIKCGLERVAYSSIILIKKSRENWSPPPKFDMGQQTYRQHGEDLLMLFFLLRNICRIKKHRHTLLSRVGFEPTIPSFERSKTVCESERCAFLMRELVLVLLLLLLLLLQLYIVMWLNGTRIFVTVA